MRQSGQSSDDELLWLMSHGEEEAFLTLYRRWQPGIYRFALQMSGSPAAAEDVTQEVFLTLMRDARNYDPARGSLGAYLYGIGRNHVLRWLDRGRSNVPLAADQNEESSEVAATLVAADNPLGDLTRRETVDTVRRAVLALPPHYREVVVLCELEEMDYADAAQVLSCSVGTIRSRLHRARGLLLGKLRAGSAKDPAVRKLNPARCIL
jgi:RNA polymerase sigma-70 factor, ECF subfamily